jgi:hypothetical protein
VTGLRPGGEVDSMCTKCKMVLAHTILAMDGGKPVRVQCNTCHGQHNYRGGASAPRPSTSRSKEPSPVRETARARASFDEQLATKNPISRAYSTKTAFKVDDTVSHPTFGLGFVIAVRGDKVDVTFSTGTRTLMHSR